MFLEHGPLRTFLQFAAQDDPLCSQTFQKVALLGLAGRSGHAVAELGQQGHGDAADTAGSSRHQNRPGIHGNAGLLELVDAQRRSQAGGAEHHRLT
ncbi:hypothetical protein D3C84_1116250 [compost metagenome]